MDRRCLRSGLDGRLFSMLDSLGLPYGKYPEVEGFPEARVKLTMVFVHGCFKHGCPKHFRLPKTKPEFWRARIEKTVERDRKSFQQLRRRGFKVLRIWEHDLKRNPGKARRLLLKAHREPGVVEAKPALLP